MEEIKINTAKTFTLTLPSDPTANNVSVSLYHEFGSLVSGPTAATRVSAGVYTITYGLLNSGNYVLNSAGKHRIEYTYTIDNNEYKKYQYFSVYTPYITEEEFFTLYPELQLEYGSLFDLYEKRTRNVINTYCGQSFDFYPNKYMILDGTNHRSLHLPVPVCTINKVTINVGDETEEIIHDSTNSSLNNIEKVRQQFNFQSSFFVRYRNKQSIGADATVSRGYDLYSEKRFSNKSDYKIEGDFGWEYVPENVQQAAAILIADFMNNDNEYRAHRMTRVDMDAISFEMKGSFYESTGNVEADVLLMDYTLFIMDYIV